MYDHYIALDWAQTNMAIAKMTLHSNSAKIIDVPSDIGEIQLYLDRLKGKKLLTFEETSTSQWLYTELKSYVDEILVCNPHRNKLLSEGAKTDKIDAQKLCHLLKSGLLKPVFHSGDEYIRLRKLISGYQDVVQAGVRSKNQRSSLFRSIGKSKKTKEIDGSIETFVLEGVDRAIEAYEKEKEKERYEEEFLNLSKKHKVIRDLQSIPGIGLVNAIKLLAIVVDGKRFKKKGNFLSYCGLIRHEKISGGRSYGSRKPRYNRTLKSVFKTAALATTLEKRNNVFRDYYLDLMHTKKHSDFNARHAVSRRIAILTLGVLKSGKKFNFKGEKDDLRSKADL